MTDDERDIWRRVYAQVFCEVSAREPAEIAAGTAIREANRAITHLRLLASDKGLHGILSIGEGPLL